MDREVPLQNGSEEERISSERSVVFNPADDSSSSYETSSNAGSDLQRTTSSEINLLASQRLLPGADHSWKDALNNPAAATGTILTPNMEGEGCKMIEYSDDQIMADAARWAASFMGPADLENASQDEIVKSTTSRPYRISSKKRKAGKFKMREGNTKHTKGLYNDNYRRLLNENIRDALFPKADSIERLPQTQIGMTPWTSNEKDSFFIALSRLGKDDVSGIAFRVGSKSEFEVQEYIQLLHQGMLEKTSIEPRRQLLGFTDMPAALQVSQECCDELEMTADALCSRQNRYEERKEKRKWGKSWLLNSDINLWVEEHLAVDEGRHNLKEVLPAAELLNLRNWLELSNRVFMNPAMPREQENWHFIAEPGEEPSIRATAFEDFYRLAVSVTKRLVSTALFCAMSRLRATDSTSFNRYDMVKSIDVEAAVKVTGLELNSTKFWRDCPRRCNLDVFKSRTVVASGQPPMDYDEVESILNYRKKDRQSACHSDGETSRPTSLAVASLSPDIGVPESSNRPPSQDPDSRSRIRDVKMDPIVRDLAFEYWQGVELEYDGPIDPSGSEYDGPQTHGTRTEKKIVAREAFDQAHLEYTEAFDIQASLLEEQRLWDILERTPPFSIKPEEVDLSERPVQERKEEDELKDWRDRIQFWSHWETSDLPLPVYAFSRPQARIPTRRLSMMSSDTGKSSPEAAREESESEMVQDADSANANDEDE